MNKSVYDIVFLALREIGVVALGDTIDAAVSQEALLELNIIRGEWSLDTKNYGIFDEVYANTTNKPFITLGSTTLTTGDIAKRPYSIDQVSVISTTGVPEQGVSYMLQLGNYDQYRQLTLQNIFAIPTTAYIDTSFPLQRIYFYPGLVPGWSVRVVGTSYMTEYENIADPYMDPPEYFGSLYSALALRLAGKYGVDLAPGVYARLKSALNHIEAKLFVNHMQPLHNGLVGNGHSFNFMAGI